MYKIRTMSVLVLVKLEIERVIGFESSEDWSDLFEVYFFIIV